MCNIVHRGADFMNNLIFIHTPAMEKVDTTKPSITFAPNDECSVLLDPFVNHHRVIELNCNPNVPHLFSAEGLEGFWKVRRASGLSESCPECRGENTPRTHFKSAEKAKEFATTEQLATCDRLAAEKLSKAGAAATPAEEEAAKKCKTFYPVMIIAPATYAMRASIAKIVETTPFKIIAIPFNCVHWAVYKSFNLLNKLVKVASCVTLMALATITFAATLFLAIATSPLTATYLLINRCRGIPVRTGLGQVGVLILSSVYLFTVPIQQLVILANKISTKMNNMTIPRHTPRSIWQGSLVQPNRTPVEAPIPPTDFFLRLSPAGRNVGA